MREIYIVWEVYNINGTSKFIVLNRLSKRIHTSWGDLLKARTAAADLNKHMTQRA